MSELTAKLVRDARPKPNPQRVRILRSVATLLTKQYGTPSLGNQEDPTREIFYILLSARTSERLYRRAFSALTTQYRSLPALAKATPDEVFEIVKVAGLGTKRAVQLIAVAKRLLEDLGPNPSQALRRMRPAEAFEYLTSLPGVGPKSALCVMMYSLRMDVFPVDVNVQRISERLGLIKTGLKHYQAQTTLPRDVPIGRSWQLHVGFVIHGRMVCKPLNPDCPNCVLSVHCQKRQTWSA